MLETSRRLLALLSLLQTPRAWSGPELARRLEVSQRTVRNDVDRLRELGYPVEATRGRVGGYRLGSGTTMPPLLLDDDEAIVVAVALRTAAGGVGDVQDTAQRALTKLLQVLPKGLAGRVDALQGTLLRSPWASAGAEGEQVTAALLSLLAGAAADREVVRFGYADHAGAASERRAEPYRLVNLGRRWYLVAFDVDRDDWRTFRLDRVREARSVGHRFRARPLPAEDVADWVAQRTRQVRQRAAGVVVVAAPADVVAQRIGWALGAVEPLGRDRCRVELVGRDPDELARGLGWLGLDFDVEGPPELARAVRRLGERYARGAGARPA